MRDDREAVNEKKVLFFCPFHHGSIVERHTRLQKSAFLSDAAECCSADAAGALQTWKLLPAHWAAAAGLLHLDLPLEPREKTQDVSCRQFIGSRRSDTLNHTDTDRNMSQPFSNINTLVLERVQQAGHTRSEKIEYSCSTLLGHSLDREDISV